MAEIRDGNAVSVQFPGRETIHLLARPGVPYTMCGRRVPEAALLVEAAASCSICLEYATDFDDVPTGRVLLRPRSSTVFHTNAPCPECGGRTVWRSAWVATDTEAHVWAQCLNCDDYLDVIVINTSTEAGGSSDE